MSLEVTEAIAEISISSQNMENSIDIDHTYGSVYDY